jgi:hypothetical protein
LYRVVFRSVSKDIKKNVQNKLRAVFPEKIQDQLAYNVILVSVWN